MSKQEEWESEYDAPAGKVWVCLACGRKNRNRVRVGDESCFMNAWLMPDDTEPESFHGGTDLTQQRGEETR